MRRISPFIETWSIYIRRRLSKGQSTCIFSALRSVDVCEKNMRRISSFIEMGSIYIRRRFSKGQSTCIFSALRNVDSWRISPFIETRSIYIRRRLSKGQSAPNLFRVTECGQLAHLTLYRDSEYIHTPSSLKRAISSESFPHCGGSVL